MRQAGALRGRSSTGFCWRRERRGTTDWRRTRQRHGSSRPPSSADCACPIWCWRAPAPTETNARGSDFIAVYRQPLLRAAIAITGSETLGRDLADQLYAELYGLTERDGERRCPLASYRGRGSLLGWLRTTLAQRHVDHHRRTRREEPLEEFDAPAPDPAPEQPARELSLLERAIEEALESAEAEDRFLLAAYYLDGQTLKQIAACSACTKPR